MAMRNFVRLAVAAIFGGGVMAFLAAASPAQAQDSLAAQYCPAVPGLPAPRLINGMCLYNVGPVTQDQCPRGYGPVSFGPLAGCAGASNSYVATQALSRTSEAITQAYTDLVNERIKRRRDQDRLGRLQQFAGAARMEYAADLPGARKPAMVAPAPVGPRPAIWVQAYGDFERRDQTQVVSFAQRTQILDISSTSRTGGVVGGIDILLPGVLGADGLLLGLTGGYADTTVKTRASQTEQKLSVGSVGIYGAWILGNFALGFNAKTDFVNMRQTYTDFLDSPPFPPVFGGFSVDGHNYSIGGTASYRFDLGASGWYIEPTVGLDYTRSTYKDGQRFGLANGSTLRGRAGAIVGTTILLSDTLALQPTFGLFAFSNLSVQSDGGSLVTFDVNSLLPAKTDEGKVYGEVQAGFNLIGTGGLSFNARGEYRFGEDLRGGAIRAGFRYQF